MPQAHAGIAWEPSVLGFYVGTGDLNSSPHACMASALPTEPSPQPYCTWWIFTTVLCLLFVVPPCVLTVFMCKMCTVFSVLSLFPGTLLARWTTVDHCVIYGLTCLCWMESWAYLTLPVSFNGKTHNEKCLWLKDNLCSVCPFVSVNLTVFIFRKSVTVCVPGIA